MTDITRVALNLDSDMVEVTGGTPIQAGRVDYRRCIGIVDKFAIQGGWRGKMNRSTLLDRTTTWTRDEKAAEI